MTNKEFEPTETVFTSSIETEAISVQHHLEERYIEATLNFCLNEYTVAVRKSDAIKAVTDSFMVEAIANATHGETLNLV